MHPSVILMFSLLIWPITPLQSPHLVCRFFAVIWASILQHLKRFSGHNATEINNPETTRGGCAAPVGIPRFVSTLNE
jgi:hypothetical protein